MKTEKVEIKNRRGLKLVIQVDMPDNPTDLVFIAHGQGGFKEQKHIQAFAEAFLENNFRSVRFDATHSLGESEGDMLNVTYDSYLGDLEDVINWARQQSWFQEPFSLCGHSMGAQSIAWYAENHPEEIKYLVPIAPTINYDLYMQTVEDKDEWQKRGYKEMKSRSKPGVIKKVGWGVNESLKRYDLLPEASKLTMQLLIIVGEKDRPCSPAHQKIFFNAIPKGKKELIEIAEVDHNFRTPESDKIAELKTTLSNWLKSLPGNLTGESTQRLLK